MIIDGKKMADIWLNDIAAQTNALGESLHLASICVGDDEGLKKFVALKQKAAQSVGMQFSSYFFDTNDEAGVRQTLQYLPVGMPTSCSRSFPEKKTSMR
jgi:5,10-methylene-tetrahydrofolate dehydrogenase/methenyl tetrahydrofolate cyclohydrolase